MGARGRAAERDRARAGALAPAPRRRAGGDRRPRIAAARLPGAGLGRRRGDLGQLAAARAGLDANAAQVAATLAEPGLLPGLDAPWLNGPRNELEEQRIEALELIAQAGLRRGGDALPEAERAARTAIALAPFRESARAALIVDPDPAREHRRGGPRLRRAAGAAARGARHRAGTRAGRAARAAARARAGAARRRAARPRGCSSATPSWPQIDAALGAACTPARAACWRSKGPPGSARRGCSVCCASGRSRRARRCSTPAPGVLEREFGFGVVRQLFEARRGDRAAAHRRPRGVRRGRGARRPVRRPQRAVQLRRDARRAPPARALHRRPAVERHRVAALRRLPRAAHRRAAGAGGDDDPHRRAGLPTSCCSASSARIRRPSRSSRGR